MLCINCLHRAGEARNGSLGHAVTLVGAFADIVLHLDDVEDFMVYFIAEVCTLSDSRFRKVPRMTCSLAIGFLLNFVVENSVGRSRFILEYALIEL
jgi:hypothetical protein